MSSLRDWFRALFWPAGTLGEATDGYLRLRAARSRDWRFAMVAGFTEPRRVLVDIEHRTALLGLPVRTAYTMPPEEAENLIRELRNAVDSMEEGR